MCSDALNGKNFQKICVTLQWYRPKVQDAYWFHPLSIYQGIQLELQSDRTRSDSPH